MAGDDDRPQRPPRAFVVDPTVAVLTVAPAIAAAYLLSKSRYIIGAVLLVLWVPAFWLLAAALDRHGHVRMWITVIGAILIFAVSVLVFFWLPTP